MNTTSDLDPKLIATAAGAFHKQLARDTNNAGDYFKGTDPFGVIFALNDDYRNELVEDLADFGRTLQRSLRKRFDDASLRFPANDANRLAQAPGRDATQLALHLVVATQLRAFANRPLDMLNKKDRSMIDGLVQTLSETDDILSSKLDPNDAMLAWLRHMLTSVREVRANSGRRLSLESPAPALSGRAILLGGGVLLVLLLYVVGT